MTDKQLIKRVQEGRRECLNDIVERYYDDILRFCTYLIGNSQDAYDLTQETFLRFIRYVDSYRYRNLKGYLIMIARNLCMDYFKGKKEGITFTEEIEKDSDDASMNQSEDKIYLDEAMAKIPPAQREIIIMRYYSELKLHEIAAILDIPLSTVKSRLRLGMEKLHDELKEEI